MGKPGNIDVDDLAQEIRRVDGDHENRLGAGALAEALMPFVLAAEKRGEERERERCAKIADQYVWDDHALAQATDIGRAVHHQAVEIASAIRTGKA